MKLELELKTLDQVPFYIGKSSVECLLLNACDGWFTAYAYFDSSNKFDFFTDFTGMAMYVPEKSYIAWVELPCSPELVERLAE